MVCIQTCMLCAYIHTCFAQTYILCICIHACCVWMESCKHVCTQVTEGGREYIRTYVCVCVCVQATHSQDHADPAAAPHDLAKGGALGATSGENGVVFEDESHVQLLGQNGQRGGGGGRGAERLLSSEKKLSRYQKLRSHMPVSCMRGEHGCSRALVCIGTSMYGGI